MTTLPGKALPDPENRTESRPSALLAARNGMLLIFLLVLGWLALDDITTDHATSFYFEYTTLVFLSVVLFLQFLGLVRRGFRILGILMTVLLAASAYAVASLPPQGQSIPIWQSGVIYATFGFFLIVGLWMVKKDMRESGQRSLTEGPGAD